MAAKVLDTYELLEDILLHLPLRRLLLAQGVNKKFSAVIRDSLKINKALFLKTSTNTSAIWQRETAARQVPEIGIETNIHYWCWKEIEQPGTPVIIANPFIKIASPSSEHSTASIDMSEETTIHLSCRSLAGCNLKCRSKTGGSGPHRTSTSLCRMLVSDPPIHRLAARSIRVDSSADPVSTCVPVFGITALHYGRLSSVAADSTIPDAEIVEFDLYGGDQLWQMPKTVDYLTGWECLEILQMSRAGRKAYCVGKQPEVKDCMGLKHL